MARLNIMLYIIPWVLMAIQVVLYYKEYLYSSKLSDQLPGGKKLSQKIYIEDNGLQQISIAGEKIFVDDVAVGSRIYAKIDRSYGEQL